MFLSFLFFHAMNWNINKETPQCNNQQQARTTTKRCSYHQCRKVKINIRLDVQHVSTNYSTIYIICRELVDTALWSCGPPGFFLIIKFLTGWVPRVSTQLYSLHYHPVIEQPFSNSFIVTSTNTFVFPKIRNLLLL